MWQGLREELHPKGLEIVTVALDARGAVVARQWIEKAAATHPSLIDETHQLDRLGVVNVPTGIWIDEAGVIVRPPEPAHPRRPAYKDQVVPADASATERERIETVKGLTVDADRYVAALRDWVDRGAASRKRPPMRTSSWRRLFTQGVTPPARSRSSRTPNASTRPTGPIAVTPGRSPVPNTRPSMERPGSRM